MAEGFSLFGVQHLLLLGAVPGVAAVISFAARARPAWQRAIRTGLGLFLAANELTWYGYRLHHEGFRFPEALPLELCDLTLWLTVAAALTLNQRAFEVAYYAGLGGSAMALVTPDLWAPFPSYPTAYFFLSHGFVVATLLALVWSGMARPRPGSVLRAFVLLNVFAGAVAVFNLYFRTNYMYLCEKPQSASLLDYFGPWPAYVAVAEVFALLVFWLLWLPVRNPRRGPPAARTRSRSS